MSTSQKKLARYDVIIIGGGHAGCEAANSAASMGASTLLLTTSLDTIGLLACSPSFGGPGRGQLLTEIDAMGGLMPRIIDETAIHFRQSGKDTIRQAPFAICDRSRYHRHIKSRLEKTENLHIKQDTAQSIVFSGGKWEARCITGQIFKAKCLVVTAGTFLRGRTSLGKSKQKAGRNNEIGADGLAKCLVELDFNLGIFRTGTGPTVKPRTLAASLEKQQYDEPPLFCSRATKIKGPRQVHTYKTHTSAQTIKIVKKQQNNQLVGPRYCPSLLDRIVKFPQKKEHPVFLQPESLQKQEWFLNGISMDFDEEIQQKVVASIRGLSEAETIRPGYSVAYRYLKPGQLTGNLESKNHRGLFFAGQVTGSNGYEEAAALGLVAGKNAALKAKKHPCSELERNRFTSVLVGDITSKKITEPYRMLLSRVAGAKLPSKIEDFTIPYSMDFSAIGLSQEAIEKLNRFQPATINEALKLDIPEKSIQALALYLERQNK